MLITEAEIEKQELYQLVLNAHKLNKADQARLVQLKARHSFLTFAYYVTEGRFQPYSVHRLICEFLQRIADGEIRKACISLPPRTGKSFLCSQLFIPYILGRNPASENMLASYIKGLSGEHAQKSLHIMNSERYRFVFPEVKLKSKDVFENIRLENGGNSKIFSVGGGCTGFGGGHISFDYFPGIILTDDLVPSGDSIQVLNSTKAWLTTQLLTRALPNSAMIMMGTRFHTLDPQGILLAAEGRVEDGGEWHVLNVPALCVDPENDPLGRAKGESHWPELAPVKKLLSIKKQIGDNTFQSLYQGEPISDEGGIFTSRDILDVDEVPYIRVKFITADTAFSEKDSSDFSVFAIWGVGIDDNLYLLDLFVDRLDFPDLVSECKKLISIWKPVEVGIEHKASGISLLQTLKREIKRTRFTALKADKSKVARANAITTYLRQNFVFVHNKCSKFESFKQQLIDFPYGLNDDMVDAFVHGVNLWAETYKGRAIVSSNSTSTHNKPSNTLRPNRSRIDTASGFTKTRANRRIVY